MMFELKNGATINIDQLLSIARLSGEAIMEIYNQDDEALKVTLKEDESPLTAADSASHNIISEQLTKLYPDIPLLSEEGKNIPYEIRHAWEYYWCIDPLDGTKEFIKRNGEFTVNIALIYKNTPVLGIIYAPAKDVMYYGADSVGSWKAANGETRQLKVKQQVEQWIAVGSRTHSSAEESSILAKYHIADVIAVGSSLKFCMVAESSAQLYYRHGPTMEWDTAAGQAIAVYSGAYMFQPDGTPFLYNKPSLLNDSFICAIKPAE